MSATATRWLKSLTAVLLGNGLYFSLAPHLPATARHHPLRLDLGILVDLWFCLVVYGVLDLAILLRKRRP
jgi:hypothetical protein